MSLWQNTCTKEITACPICDKSATGEKVQLPAVEKELDCESFGSREATPI